MPFVKMEEEKLNLKKLYPDIKRVYTVVRTWKENPDEKKKDECKKKEDENKEGDYGRCSYRVGFKVDQEVTLVGLDFFGPVKNEIANYGVEVSISRTEEDWGCFGCIRGYFCGLPMYRIVEIMPYHCQFIRARKGENLTVTLPRPVKITPDLWTDIKFELNGPKTKFAHFLTCEHIVDVEGKGPVRFDFLRGSKQLRALHFK